MVKLTRFNTIVLSVVLWVGSVFATYQLAVHTLDRQFRVIYNLDTKQNDQEIIRIIDRAQRYVYFAIFTFTKENIADALIRAKQRGIIVAGLADSGQAAKEYEKPIIQKLIDAGVRIETQKHPEGIMHIKAVVTDKEYAAGSYNWTEAATVANDEVLEISTNSSLHDQYFSIIRKLLIANH